MAVGDTDVDVDVEGGVDVMCGERMVLEWRKYPGLDEVLLVTVGTPL